MQSFKGRMATDTFGKKVGRFMLHKHSNKTAIQSQHMIADALFSLMKRKPLQKIAITEICEEAALGRKTFYRNFDQKEDVIAFRLEMLYQQYEQEIQGMTNEEQLYHHFEFIKQNAVEFIALYQNGLHELAYQRFSSLLPRTMPVWSSDPVEQEYRSNYIIYGIEAVQRVWVKREFVESVDELITIVQRMQEGQQPLTLK